LATSQFAPIVSMLVTVAISIFVLTIVSFLIARHFGGTSRPKRKAIFVAVSGLGFIGILYFMFLRTSGRA
jgi:hypothetical protein